MVLSLYLHPGRAALSGGSNAKYQFPLEAGPVTGLEKRRDVWTRKHELSAKSFGGAGPVCARGRGRGRRGKGEKEEKEEKEVNWRESRQK